MKLAKEQIDQLFAFTKKKYVRFYDLQVELVDHLATRIEEEMNANPQLDFEKALAKVYAEFGLFGFAKIVQEKEKEVSRANRKIWYKELWKYFTIPKVSLLVSLFAFFYLLTGIATPEITFTITFAGWFIYNIYTNRVYKKLKQKTVKDLLLLQFVSHYSFYWTPFYHYFMFKAFGYDETIFLGTGSRLLFTIVVVSTIIFQVVSVEVFKKVQTKAFKLYPEAFATVA